MANSPITPARRKSNRIANVMQKHMLHSEHAALCYIEACRRDRAKARAAKKATASPYDCGGNPTKDYPGE